MLIYDQYFKQLGLRQVGDIRKIHSWQQFTELPIGSIYHHLGCLGNPISQETPPVPNMEIFSKFVGDRRTMIFPELDHTTTDNVVPVDSDGIRAVTSQVYKEVKKLRSGTCLLVKNPLELHSSATIQSMILYDPLMTAKMTGRLTRVRMFNVILSKLLTHVANMPDQTHFVYLPVENLSLTPAEFVKSLKGYQRTAYAHPESYYYLFMMHLYGFLQQETTDSFFEKVGANVLEKLNIVLVNEDTDRCVHLRLDRLKEFSVKDPFIAKKMLQVFNIVAREQPPGRDIGEVAEQLTVIPEQVTAGTSETINATQFKEPPTEEVLRQQAVEQVELRDKEAITRIANSEQLTPAQKQTAAKNASAYKSIKIGEYTIAEHMTNTGQEISKLENSVADVVDVPDKSVTESSVANFATDYMKQSFERDMASTLASFGKQGMYVTDVKTEDLSDELNEIMKYTVTFRDEEGRSHTIKYRMPKVDNEGNCLINGSKKRISIQRINTPICKVSPTRVFLTSSANKTIVERNASFSNTLVKQLRRYLEKTKLEIKATLGSNSWPNLTLPSEYADVAKTYTDIKGLGINFSFDYDLRLPKNDEQREAILKQEQKLKAVYLGTFKGTACYMDLDSNVLYGDAKTRLINILDEVLVDVTFAPYSEWVNIILLNKKFPVIFLLAYRFGFENILRYMKVNYDKLPKGARLDSTPSDIVIRTYDVTYVLRNPTTVQRYIFSGMNHFNLKEIEHTALDERDAYFTMLESRGLSIEYLRGIDFLFDLFLDPITIDVLQQMGEPTNMRDLLIRATVLLTTSDHREASSSTNFRFRSYEQFNSILYKTLARALSTYQNKSIGHKSKFSISEFDVFTNIVTDPMFNNINVVNPIATIKDSLHYTHIGDGGRAKDTMMIPDRRYPEDGVGIISEGTPDSFNVGIDGILSVNATVANTRGLCVTKKARDVSNSELLSPTALVYPGATMDDAKRAK